MIEWSTCPAVESLLRQGERQMGFQGHPPALYALFENLAAGATIHDFVEWFDGAEEEKVTAVLECVAQEFRAKVPHAHSV